MISLVEWGAWADPEAYLDFYAFFMTSMVEWGAWGGPSIIENDFFGGVGSVGSPESLKMHGFRTCLIISSVGWEAWKAQDH